MYNEKALIKVLKKRKDGRYLIYNDNGTYYISDSYFILKTNSLTDKVKVKVFEIFGKIPDEQECLENFFGLIYKRDKDFIKKVKFETDRLGVALGGNIIYKNDKVVYRQLRGDLFIIDKKYKEIFDTVDDSRFANNALVLTNGYDYLKIVYFDMLPTKLREIKEELEFLVEGE